MTKLMALALLLCAQTVFAHGGENKHIMNAPPAMPKEFDRLRNLVGTWEGTADMGDGAETPVKVIYELTSGGTALTEKMMPGSNHEMTSIYYKDGKSMAMTHYCAMGNHPEMKLKKADDKTLNFEMKGTAGVASMKEPHMHALAITMPDDNTLVQEWTSFEGGKAQPAKRFTYKRKM